MSLVGGTFLDLLEQDALWRTSDGRVLEVGSMDAAHRANVLRLLERMAADLYREGLTELIQSFDYQELAMVRSRALEPFLAPQPEPRIWAWFERRPLVRRLRELEAGTGR